MTMPQQQRARAIPGYAGINPNPQEILVDFIAYTKGENIATILREHGKNFRQIKRRLRDNSNGRCAIGVVVDYANTKYTGIGYELHFNHTVHELMTRMNDKHGYTFEHIADWLDHI